MKAVMNSVSATSAMPRIRVGLESAVAVVMNGRPRLSGVRRRPA